MQEQAQGLIDWMKAGETISQPVERPITLANLIDSHPGKALILLALAALTLLALIGN